jgi:hypothetical protein
MCGTRRFSDGSKRITFQAAATSLTASSSIPRDPGETRGGGALSKMMYSEMMTSMHNCSVRGLAAACLLFAGSLSTGVLAAGDGALPAARQELRLRVETERRMRHEFESLFANRGMSAAEISDFENYLARLTMLVAEQRALLAKLEESDSHSGAGSGHTYSQASSLPADFDRGQTDAEKIATLDAELGSSLSGFDEKLLREQREIDEKSRSASTGESGAQAGAGAGKTGKAGEGEGQGQGDTATSNSAESAAESTPDGNDSSGESGQQSAGGKSEEAAGQSNEQVAAAGGSGRNPAKNPPPPDIADGKDDDIVARQLREAAEDEQDPELRDKLWEEYRNYKNSTQ